MRYTSNFLRGLLIASLAGLPIAAQALDNGQYGGVPDNVRSWFKSVRSPHGVPCCDISDGHRTAFDMRPDGYYVPIEGEWRQVPPEAIVGYITVGRGVSIHSRSCANLARLSVKAPARVLAVDWGNMGSAAFPVDIEIQAFDRRGLVRDVSAALADEKIGIQGMTTVTDKQENVAHMRISISISGLPQLSKVLSRIALLPNIISARRKK